MIIVFDKSCMVEYSVSTAKNCFMEFFKNVIFEELHIPKKIWSYGVLHTNSIFLHYGVLQKYNHLKNSMSFCKFYHMEYSICMEIKLHPCEEVEELSPFTSCLLASALGGRTESLFAIAFSMKGEEGGWTDTFSDGKFI